MPQEWDEKGKLVDRAVSEWDEKGNPVQKAGQPDPNEAFSQATALSPDTRSWTGKVGDRIRQWWNDPKGSKSPKEFAGGLANEALLLAPAATPEKVASTAGKVALNLAGRTATGLAGAGAGGWAGREAGLTGAPLTAARVAGGATGFFFPETVGKLGRGGRFASRMLNRAAPEAAPPEAVVGTSTAQPVGTAQLPPAPTTPQAPMTLGARTAARTGAAPSTGVTRVPVPRAPMPGDPNLMGSVPRPELPEMAERGVPGAADQQRLLGEPVVYTPPEGYPPPRSVTNLSERVPQPESPNLTQRTAAPQYQMSEKAATLSEPPRDLGPEFNAQQRQEMLSRYKSILRNPRATPEDLAEANARLREMGVGNGTPPASVPAPVRPDRAAQRVARERAARIREARQ